MPHPGKKFSRFMLSVAQYSSVPDTGVAVSSDPSVGITGDDRRTPGRLHYLHLSLPKHSVKLRLGNWGSVSVDDTDFGGAIHKGLDSSFIVAQHGRLHNVFNFTYNRPWRLHTDWMTFNVWNCFITRQWPMTWETFNDTMATLEYFHHNWVPLEARFDIYEGNHLMGQGNFSGLHTKPPPDLPPHHIYPDHPSRPDHRIPSSPRPFLTQGNQSADANQTAESWPMATL